MADPLEQAAEEWLASRGQADLSLYWPTNKPIPQIDYESGQPKPALLDLMAAFARSPAVRRELLKENVAPDFDPIAVDLARETYDRFVMGGWSPPDAHAEIVLMLMRWWEERESQ